MRAPTITGDGAPFATDVRLRFRDLDMFGHVNHVQYFSFCEEHRTAFFEMWREECGIDMLDRGFVVAHASCDYSLPLGREASSVRIEMTVDGLGRSSVRLCYRILSSSVLVAVVRYVLVLVGPSGASRPLSSVERAMLARYDHEGKQ